MYINLTVTECDFSGRKYDEPVKGVGAIARGASGRYCVVMYGGPEYRHQLLALGNEILTEDEARARIEENGDGWPDF